MRLQASKLVDSKEAVARLRMYVAKMSGKRQSLTERKNELSARLIEIAKEQDEWGKANILLQQTAGVGRTHLVQLVEPLLTKALKLFLGENASFRIDYKESGGAIEAHLVTRDNENIEGERDDSHGGGVLDLEAVLFRIIFILRMGLPRILILDEPFRNVHGEKGISILEEFLKDLAERLNFQIIIITGDENTSENVADNILTVSKENGESQIEYKAN